MQPKVLAIVSIPTRWLLTVKKKARRCTKIDFIRQENLGRSKRTINEARKKNNNKIKTMNAKKIIMMFTDRSLLFPGNQLDAI